MIPIESQQIFTWESFLELTKNLVAAGKTSGPDQSENLVYFTSLNLRRMKRVYKTTKLLPETLQALENIKTKQIWWVLTETWCGDAAQTVPVLARMAETNPHIELRLILRDENLEVMDRYLTGTARAIPKVIMRQVDDQRELGVWGPRPTEAQALVMKAKAIPDYPYEQLSEDVQVWYNHDKSIQTQKELVAVIEQQAG